MGEVNYRADQVETSFTIRIDNVNREIGSLGEFRNRVEKRHREATDKRKGEGAKNGNPPVAIQQGVYRIGFYRA